MSGGQPTILAVLALVVGLAAGVPTGRWQLRRDRNQGSVLAVLGGGLGAVLLLSLADRYALPIAAFLLALGLSATIVTRRDLKATGRL